MQLELSTTKLQLLHLCRAQRLRHGSKKWVVVKMVKMLFSKHTSTPTATKYEFNTDCNIETFKN